MFKFSPFKTINFFSLELFSYYSFDLVQSQSRQSKNQRQYIHPLLRLQLFEGRTHQSSLSRVDCNYFWGCLCVCRIFKRQNMKPHQKCYLSPPFVLFIGLFIRYTRTDSVLSLTLLLHGCTYVCMF